MIPINEFTILGQKVFKADAKALADVRRECMYIYDVPNLESLDYAEVEQGSFLAALSEVKVNYRRALSVRFDVQDGMVRMADRWMRVDGRLQAVALEKARDIDSNAPATFGIHVGLDFDGSNCPSGDFPEGDSRRVLRNSRKEWHFFSEANYSAMLEQPFELSITTTPWQTEVHASGHRWETIAAMRRMLLDRVKWLESNPVVYFGKHLKERLPLKEGLHRLAADEWRKEYMRQKADHDKRIADPTFRSVKTKFARGLKRYKELLNSPRAYQDYDIKKGYRTELVTELKFPLQNGQSHIELPEITFTTHMDGANRDFAKTTLMRNSRRYSRDQLCSLLENYASKAQTKKMLQDIVDGGLVASNDGKKKLLAEALLSELF